MDDVSVTVADVVVVGYDTTDIALVVVDLDVVNDDDDNDVGAIAW